MTRCMECAVATLAMPELVALKSVPARSDARIMVRASVAPAISVPASAVAVIRINVLVFMNSLPGLFFVITEKS